MASDASMPCTSIPSAASGSAIRPVPIASSSIGPSAASLARNSTVSPELVGGWNRSS
jgi:hypothetical protein